MVITVCFVYIARVHRPPFMSKNIESQLSVVVMARPLILMLKCKSMSTFLGDKLKLSIPSAIFPMSNKTEQKDTYSTVPLEIV